MGENVWISTEAMVLSGVSIAMQWPPARSSPTTPRSSPSGKLMDIHSRSSDADPAGGYGLDLSRFTPVDTHHRRRLRVMPAQPREAATAVTPETDPGAGRGRKETGGRVPGRATRHPR